jgi:acylglycerol lipase
MARSDSMMEPVPLGSRILGAIPGLGWLLWLASSRHAAPRVRFSPADVAALAGR